MDFVDLDDPDAATDAGGVSGREVEIFVDHLAMHACDEASYFLDHRYESWLSDAERDLATALGSVGDVLQKGHGTGPARIAGSVRDKVEGLLAELGRPETSRAQPRIEGLHQRSDQAG